MPKGKHGKAAQHRREASQASSLEELRAELVRQFDAAEEAEAKAADGSLLSERLSRLQSRRDAAVAPDLEQTTFMLSDLEKAVAEEESLIEELDSAWSPVWDLLIAAEGGGVRGIEKAGVVLKDFRRGMTLLWGGEEAARGYLDSAAIRRIQVARGDRAKSDEPEPTQTPTNLELIRPTLIAAAGEDDAAMRALRARNATLRRSTLTHPNRDVAWAWAVVSALTRDWEPGALAEFGAVDGDAAKEWLESASTDDPAAANVRSATRSSGRIALDGSRWRSPVQAPMAIGRPTDATTIRWLYWFESATAETTAEEMMSQQGAPADSPPDDLDFSEEPHAERAVMWREVADVLAAASLYWLPRGQAMSYLSSLPLDEADSADLRMPHGLTMVVPAEPLLLAPTAPYEEDVDEPLHLAVKWARSAVVRGSRGISDTDHTTARVNVGEAIAAHGALVEGVLFEADRAGRRTDRIVWCLAVPTGGDIAVIGRVAVPAFASRSRWRVELEQLAAVAAWGDWAEVPEEAAAAEKGKAQPKDEPRRGVAPAIRVLDVRRTEGDDGGATATSRHVAPHLRRGHWRRQRYGAGRQEIRRVRIAPVLVNAARGPLAQRVYRLPSKTTTEEPSGVGSAAQPSL
jgi:hypothetical protein